MALDVYLLKLIASIFVRERKASVRWAQMRRITCGGCGARFWVLATREVEGTSLGVRVVTEEETTIAKALAAARKRAMDESEGRSAAMVSCPECGWVPAGVNFRAWIRAAFLGLLPAGVAAVVIVPFAMLAVPDAPISAICAVGIGASWALASWVVRAFICRLPWGLAMDRYPTASLAWGNDLLVACDGEFVSPEESWLRQEAISTPTHGLVLAPPVDL